MIGKITKGIAGFYYVHVNGKGTYECKAKGVFRKKQVKPLVGDEVEIQVIDEKNHIGNLEKILPRKNELIRPAVANIDQALVIFSTTSPTPNFHLMNRFLVMMEYYEIPVMICFNKLDLCNEKEQQELVAALLGSDYPIYFVSAYTKEGIDELKELLKGKTTTVAGPSGVGKSSLINLLQETVEMETGMISEKIGRGKHTTRHSQLISIDESSYIFDTPGFSSIFLPELEKSQLRYYFSEYSSLQKECKFLGCLHYKEPDCAVKQAVQEGVLSKSRYEDYCSMLEELSQNKYS